MKRMESTSFNLDYIPSTSAKYHQQVNEEQRHIHGLTKTKSSNKQQIQEYDNLDNISTTKRKTKTDQKVLKKTNSFLKTNHFSASDRNTLLIINWKRT